MRIFALLALALLAGCATPSKPSLSGSLRGVTICNGWSRGISPKDYKSAGADVLGCELCEWITAGDLLTVEKSQADKLVKVKADCDKAGMWLEVILNSNDGLNWQANATAARIAGLDYVKAKLGTDLIIQPWSENGQVPVNATAVRQHANAIFARVVQYGSSGVPGKPWTEQHPQSIYSGLCGLPNAPSSWIVTDSGQLIVDGHSPDLYVNYLKNGGTASFSLYGTAGALTPDFARKVYKP